MLSPNSTGKYQALLQLAKNEKERENSEPNGIMTFPSYFFVIISERGTGFVWWIQRYPPQRKHQSDPIYEYCFVICKTVQMLGEPTSKNQERTKERKPCQR